MADPKKTKLPIKQRIIDALAAAPGGKLGYHVLMHAVFPQDDYPKAWRYQSNGGPPGCAMAFGRALRELGNEGRAQSWGSLSDRCVALVRKENAE